MESIPIAAHSAKRLYDEWGRTALVNAVLEQNVERVRELSEDAELVNVPDVNGSTPAIVAAHLGNLIILNHLVNKGGCLLAKDKFGFDTLLRAAMAGHFEVIIYLLERGLPVDSLDKNEYTPMIWAAVRGHHSCVRLLLGRGANIDRQNIFGSTALMEAALRGNLDLVRLLVEMGADLNRRNMRGMDALKMALYKKQKETAVYLISEGCDVVSGDRRGFTALMWCAKWDYQDIASLLLNKGADLNSRTDAGLTAIGEAKRKGNDRFVAFLECYHEIAPPVVSEGLPEPSALPLADLMEKASLPMAVLDQYGTILLANRELATWFGYKRAQLRGVYLGDLVSTEDGLGRSGIADVFNHRSGSVELNISHTQSSGEIRQLRWVLSREAKSGYFLGIAEDFTERERRESQHRQSLKMEAIGQLAGGIAHDFNNQLAGILGYSEVLLQGGEQGEQEKYVHRIVTCARNAANLTQKLLAFSRKGHFRHVAVHMHTIIDEVLTILRHTIDKRITIRYSYEAEDDLTSGDPTLLQNALLNLCLNARDAMPSGGELYLHTRNVLVDENFMKSHDYYMKRGSYMEIEVSDSGIGMSPEVRSKIFEPFFTTKAQGSGTGMGLAAVYGTVKGHKGAINVYSEVGMGTVFKVYLPLNSNAQKPSNALDPGSFMLPSKKILIVDDEGDVRDMVKAFLKHRGHIVFTCKDGGEGLSFYRENWRNIDIVILDMVMPVLSGEETFVGMKLINPNIKCILISGYSRNRQVQKLIDLGIHEFLQKPFESNRLFKAMADILLE